LSIQKGVFKWYPFQNDEDLYVAIAQNSSLEHDRNHRFHASRSPVRGFFVLTMAEDRLARYTFHVPAKAAGLFRHFLDPELRLRKG